MRSTRSRRHVCTRLPNQGVSCARAAASSAASSPAGSPTHEAAISACPAGAYDEATALITATLLTGPVPSPSSTMRFPAGASAAAYQRHVEPRGSGAGIPARAQASTVPAAITTASLALSVSPEARVTLVLPTLVTRSLRWMLPPGSRAASWSAIAPMPRAGTTVRPDAIWLKTWSIRWLETFSSGSRKTPR